VDLLRQPPVGVIGFVLAWMLVPDLETHPHRFDMVGVFLRDRAVPHRLRSAGGQLRLGAVGLGDDRGRRRRHGALHLAAGEDPQRAARAARLFRDRNFSVANFGIATVGFTVTAMSAADVLLPVGARSHADGLGAAAHPDGGAAGVLADRGPDPRPGRPRVLLVPGCC
jgi:hypothetical protein